MNDKKERRTHSEELKQQIVQLYNIGKSKAEICREYDLAHSLLDRWIKRINATGLTRERDNRTPQEIELLKLRNENKQLKMDVHTDRGGECNNMILDEGLDTFHIHRKGYTR